LIAGLLGHSIRAEEAPWRGVFGHLRVTYVPPDQSGLDPRNLRLAHPVALGQDALSLSGPLDLDYIGGGELQLPADP
jgi:hypothetical protein